MKKLKFGIQEDSVINERKNYEKDNIYSDKWKYFCKKYEIEYKELNLLDNDFADQIKECDIIMWRWAHNPFDKQSAKQIMNAIETVSQKKIFPNSETSWHYDDKIAQNYLLKLIGAPLPEAWVFWKKNEALTWLKKARYPLIFKLTSGAGSANVIKLASYSQATKITNRMFDKAYYPYKSNEFSILYSFRKGMYKRSLGLIRNSLMKIFTGNYIGLLNDFWVPERRYVYFQEFLKDNKYDTRVTIIGNRAFAYRRFNRPNDFRASGSGNFSVDPSFIDTECLKIAFEVSEKCNFQAMAYDFLYKNQKPVICEISYTFVDWMVHECPGHWDSDLTWHEGHMWPEEAHILDLVQSIQ